MLTGDLVRLLLLSAASLVIVIAFAATLRPVAEGRIGAADALKFMAYATLPMLQFALPFSAAFAATLAYHRFGADNESLAASSGGISAACTEGGGTALAWLCSRLCSNSRLLCS